MHAPALSEVFWEVVETFVEGKGYLLTDLREGMLADRAELYAEVLRMRMHLSTAALGSSTVRKSG